MTTIPTTFPTKTPTTVPTSIPTTIPTTVLTTILTSIPNTIPPTLSTPKTTIIYDRCIYGAVIGQTCVFVNMTSSDIANKVKNEVLETYPQDGINIVIPANDNYAFQLTSTSNELEAFGNNMQNDNGLSIINLNHCEQLLKQENNIPDNSSLIVLKYEKITGIASEKSIQYEIYNPSNFQKLDLSICENTDIDIAIPIHVEEEIKDLYDDLKENGYDLFDKNNKFYIDICTPFKAENGADVLLADRLYYYFSKIVNLTTCPSNCQYSTFSIDTKYLSCQCEVNNDYIDVDNSEKYIGKLLYSTSDYVLKYTSYKTLKCYKLVFSFKHFIKNSGGMIILLLILIDIGFTAFYIIKGISPLKVSISKLVLNEQDVDNKLSPFLNSNKQNKNKNKNKNINSIISTDNRILSSKKKNPPKKAMVKSLFSKGKDDNKTIVTTNQNKAQSRNQTNKINNNNNNIIIDTYGQGGKLNNSGNLKLSTVNTINSNNNTKKNIKIDATGTKSFYLNINRGSDKKLMSESNSQKIIAKSVKPNKTKKKEKSKENKSFGEKPKKKIKIKEILESSSSIIENYNPNKDEIILDDYELNHLDCLNALELDKRNFCKTYCSLLKRDQLIMNTFISCDDYNLFYVKGIKFIFILCTLMTMNAFLFADKSFHKLFISGVNYYFSYQFLQILLSVVITYVVEIILSLLSYTDKYIYEIKALPKKESDGIYGEKIFKILKNIRIRLLIFYLSTFIILLFYWYSVSAFCAVYPNTQKIYIIDCVLSFLFFSMIPFIVYIILTFLRIISLKDVNRKRYNCLYKCSQCFPFF